ncbi:uncharacterized protein LOC128241087 [Mya arenaria]|uniref:uncharacterized protein LOC128241087 n=1 Tax=Mya arenaria TaxID=6604 RepID=UPI0022E18102|nr:uncharacterized protein LOC128241087 [Mya arenaria]
MPTIFDEPPLLEISAPVEQLSSVDEEIFNEPPVLERSVPSTSSIQSQTHQHQLSVNMSRVSISGVADQNWTFDVTRDEQLLDATVIFERSLDGSAITDTVLQDPVEVRFEVLENGTERGGKKFVSSDSFSYTQKQGQDVSKFPKCEWGASLALQDIIRKADDARHLVITKNRKAFVTAGIKVPPLESHSHWGCAMNPQAAAAVPLDKALQSPQKTRVSVSGKIVQEEAVCTVKVCDEDVAIKVITLEADSQRAKVSLWRESGTSDVRPGDFMTITDVVTLNHYKGEPSLSTTNRSTLKI